MASRLEDYDAANIEELKAAQVKQQSLIATMAGRRGGREYEYEH